MWFLQAPKSLLSLGAMLDEYISLKEQKMMVEREKIRLDQEKLRVQTLLQGMQDAMNAYNAGGCTPHSGIPALGTKSTAIVHQLDPTVGPLSGTALFVSLFFPFLSFSFLCGYFG